MDASTREKIVNEAGRLMADKYHCSEAILLSVGKYYLPDLNSFVTRLATPFAVGAGCSKKEMCGGLSGGLLVIGALYGREDSHVSDSICQKLAKQWRENYIDEFGYAHCEDIRKNWIGKPGQEDCNILIMKVAGLLVDLLESVKE
jgi:C_GCAxxG_C_C family probable redox protein